MNNQQLDQKLGSILEAWINRGTPGACRFCNEPVDGALEPSEQFCSEQCEERFETVMDARIALGQRDMEQRGYD